jgi:hypothetical protein
VPDAAAVWQEVIARYALFPEALARARTIFADRAPADWTLSDAQHVIARERNAAQRAEHSGRKEVAEVLRPSG